MKYFLNIFFVLILSCSNQIEETNNISNIKNDTITKYLILYSNNNLVIKKNTTGNEIIVYDKDFLDTTFFSALNDEIFYNVHKEFQDDIITFLDSSGTLISQATFISEEGLNNMGSSLHSLVLIKQRKLFLRKYKFDKKNILMYSVEINPMDIYTSFQEFGENQQDYIKLILNSSYNELLMTAFTKSRRIKNW